MVPIQGILYPHDGNGAEIPLNLQHLGFNIHHFKDHFLHAPIRLAWDDNAVIGRVDRVWHDHYGNMWMRGQVQSAFTHNVKGLSVAYNLDIKNGQITKVERFRVLLSKDPTFETCTFSIHK